MHHGLKKNLLFPPIPLAPHTVALPSPQPEIKTELCIPEEGSISRQLDRERRGMFFLRNKREQITHARGAGSLTTRIAVTPPVHCGVQGVYRVSGTSYVKQAAEFLIGDNGKLERERIAEILNELDVDAARPENDQMLGEYHREHISRTLNAILQNDDMLNTVNQTCENKSLSEPAADLVRSTLLLPSTACLGKVEARRVLVMALLGNLRQDYFSGDCFAVAPAIALRQEAPWVVAAQLRKLLEDSCTEMKSDGMNVLVPLNRRTGCTTAEVKLHVRADGVYLGHADNPISEEEHDLHEIPGMVAALRSLGVPQDEHPLHVAMALKNLIGRDNQETQKTQPISCEEIIESVARTCTQSSSHLSRNVAQALDAFAGTEEVRFLRAWVHTQATRAASYQNNLHAKRIWEAVLYGTSTAHKPDMNSAFGVNSRYQKDSIFRGIPAKEISHALFDNMGHLMKMYYRYEYDGKIKDKDFANEAGGVALCEQLSDEESGQWNPIDRPESFQASMLRLAEEAAQLTEAALDNFPGDAQLNKKALRLLTDQFKQHIEQSGFAETIAIAFNWHCRNEAVFNPSCTPWARADGGSTSQILETWGSKYVVNKIIPPASDPQDAEEWLDVLLCALSSQGRKLVDRMNKTGGNFGLIHQNSLHTYSILPMAMKEVWENQFEPEKNLSPKEWRAKHLEAPALAYMNKVRYTPSVHDILSSIKTELSISNEKITCCRKQLMDKGQLNGSQLSYTLQDLYGILCNTVIPQSDSTGLREKIKQIVVRHVPPDVEKIRIADLNFGDENTNPVFLGAIYDPFDQKTRVYQVDQEGYYAGLVDPGYFSGKQSFAAPLFSIVA